MKIVQTCLEQSIDGITVSNTTPITSNKLQSKSGGLSGKPIFENMIEMIRDIKYEVGQKIDISACGGISTGKDVLEAIKAGAKATQTVQIRAQCVLVLAVRALSQFGGSPVPGLRSFPLGVVVPSAIPEG